MSLDDPRNPHHAAALERGDYPGKQDTAQFRLATLLGEHDDVHTIHHQMRVAGRVLAFLPRIQAWADAEKPQAAAPQLRQQQVATADDETFFIEQAAYHKHGYEEAMGVLSKMGSRAADGYDPDAVAVDREDDRAREARQDDAANEQAPSVRAS